MIVHLHINSVVVPVEVPSISKIDLFENDKYSTEMPETI